MTVTKDGKRHYVAGRWQPTLYGIQCQAVAANPDAFPPDHPIHQEIAAALEDGVDRPGPASTDRLRATLIRLIDEYGLERVRKALDEVSR